MNLRQSIMKPFGIVGHVILFFGRTKLGSEQHEHLDRRPLALLPQVAALQFGHRLRDRALRPSDSSRLGKVQVGLDQLRMSASKGVANGEPYTTSWSPLVTPLEAL